MDPELPCNSGIGAFDGNCFDLTDLLFGQDSAVVSLALLRPTSLVTILDVLQLCPKL